MVAPGVSPTTGGREQDAARQELIALRLTGLEIGALIVVAGIALSVSLYQNNCATIQRLLRMEETLNWVRLSQRFPVRVVLEDSAPAFPFRMGATAVVTIQGDR